MNALARSVLSGLGWAALASIIAAFAACVAMVLTADGKVSVSDVGLLLMLLLIGFLTAFPHALLFGLPYTWLLRRWRCESLWTMAAGGFVIGAVPMFVLMGHQEAVMLCGVSGAAGAAGLHLEVRRRQSRPAAA